ncbi:MAG: hypothetical protein ACRENH_15685, partial [Gemmatimonadaceae bacterium]
MRSLLLIPVVAVLAACTDGRDITAPTTSIRYGVGVPQAYGVGIPQSPAVCDYPPGPNAQATDLPPGPTKRAIDYPPGPGKQAADFPPGPSACD